MNMDRNDYMSWLKKEMKECLKKMEMDSPRISKFFQKPMSTENKQKLLETVERVQEVCKEAIEKGNDVFGPSNRILCNQRHASMECSERCGRCNIGINITFNPNPFSDSLIAILGDCRTFKEVCTKEQNKRYKRIKKEIYAILKSY